MNTAYISFGSNEGDRLQWISNALDLIAKHCGNITCRSSLYETAAWGITDQADFLNGVILLETYLSAPALLNALLETERSLGRQRDIKWGPRTIDLDILFYNNDIIDLPGLKVPHPFLQERRFILTPLAEIAPEYVHPQLHQSVIELLTDCSDQLPVRKFQQ